MIVQELIDALKEFFPGSKVTIYCDIHGASEHIQVSEEDGAVTLNCQDPS